MPKGNAYDPFCSDGINWEGSRGDGGWGPEDAGHLDAKANRRGLRSETGIGDVQTPLDRPTIASDQRAKRSSSDECLPWNSYPYGGPSRREE